MRPEVIVGMFQVIKGCVLSLLQVAFRNITKILCSDLSQQSTGSFGAGNTDLKTIKYPPKQTNNIPPHLGCNKSVSISTFPE